MDILKKLLDERNKDLLNKNQDKLREASDFLDKMEYEEQPQI